MIQPDVTKRVAGLARWGVLATVFVCFGHAAGQWVREETLPVQPGYFGGSVAISGDVAHCRRGAGG
jgi:hypothetical protein